MQDEPLLTAQCNIPPLQKRKKSVKQAASLTKSKLPLSGNFNNAAQNKAHQKKKETNELLQNEVFEMMDVTESTLQKLSELEREVIGLRKIVKDIESK